MNTRNLKYFIGLIVIVFTIACSKSDDEEDTAVSFSSQIAPFFDNTCTACHYGGRQAPDLRAAYSYSQLIDGEFIVPGNASESLLIHQLETGHPEEGVVSQTQVNIIKVWINQGAQNN